LPYSLIPPPQDLQTCLERTTLPEGYIELPIAEVTEKRTGKTREAIIDGDTIRVELEDKIAGVRFKGVNTTEFGKGPTLEARLERAEPGAIKAWEELKGLLAAAGYKVYVRPERLDHYGRFVSQVFVKAPGGKFIDVEAFLVKRGLGMAYFVQVTDPQAYSCLLALQAQAQQERKGLWSLPEFLDRNDPEKKKFKPLHITSFHPKGARDKGIEEPLYNEYFRIVNISGQPINLMDYVIFNKVSGEKVVLPYFIVPPGRTVKIASGDIETNADPDNPEKDLVLSLLFKKPFWENKEKYGEGTCLIIQDLNSRTVDASAKYGYEGCE
jgi:endonuclease YncB( thermonuclease family)